MCDTLHANVAENAVALLVVEELGKHLPTVQERVRLVEVILTSIATTKTSIYVFKI